jgi:hypothetical protein
MNMSPQLRYFLRRAVLAAALFLQLMDAPSFAESAKPLAPPQYAVPDPWGGFGLGLGVSVSGDLGRQSHIVQATNVNGIVRIKDTQDVIVGFVLEAHYFFSQGPLWAQQHSRPWNPHWGTGPFVAIEIGGGGAPASAAGPITAYGLGWMIGFRQPSSIDANGIPSYTSRLSWNLGIGLRVDPGAKVLGDGIVANQPVPPLETGNDIRLKTSPRYGLMIVSSFGF